MKSSRLYIFFIIFTSCWEVDIVLDKRKNNWAARNFAEGQNVFGWSAGSYLLFPLTILFSPESDIFFQLEGWNSESFCSHPAAGYFNERVLTASAISNIRIDRKRASLPTPSLSIYLSEEKRLFQ